MENYLHQAIHILFQVPQFQLFLCKPLQFSFVSVSKQLECVIPIALIQTIVLNYVRPQTIDWISNSRSASVSMVFNHIN